MMMKLPILPCAEKLELVLSTAVLSVYDFRAQLQGTGSRSEVLCEKFE